MSTIFLPPTKQADQVVLDTSGFHDKLSALDSQVQEFANEFDTHTHAFSEITGTLGNSQFSAYGDLIAESKIGPLSTQVAAGDHIHGPTTWDLTVNSLIATYGAEINSLAIPATPILTAGATGTLSEVEHFIIITAVDKAGNESAQSVEASLVLGAGENSISITWAVVPGAVSYRIWPALVTASQTGFFTSLTNSFDLITLVGISTNTLPQSATAANLNGNILPKTDDSYDLGSPDFRWDDIYSTNGNIQTSDENLKTDFKPLVSNLFMLNQLVPVSYRFKNGNRTHWGFGARAVEKVVGNPAVIVKNHDLYGLRYTEFIAPLVGAVQELDKKNEVLEKVIASILNSGDLNQTKELIERQQGQTNSYIVGQINGLLNRTDESDQNQLARTIQVADKCFVLQNRINELEKNADNTKLYIVTGAIGFLSIVNVILHFI